MPRYRYQCESCTKIQLIFHLMQDDAPVCQLCDSENQMKKLLTIPKIVVGNTPVANTEVGDITNEHIEANREILEQQKQEAKKETHEPS
jgi:putative FmdB family regulatory protein